jgi:hypothetical protein
MATVMPNSDWFLSPAPARDRNLLGDPMETFRSFERRPSGLKKRPFEPTSKPVVAVVGRSPSPPEVREPVMFTAWYRRALTRHRISVSTSAKR